jgi:hypothetical protein
MTIVHNDDSPTRYGGVAQVAPDCRLPFAQETSHPGPSGRDCGDVALVSDSSIAKRKKCGSAARIPPVAISTAGSEK